MEKKLNVNQYFVKKSLFFSHFIELYKIFKKYLTE